MSGNINENCLIVRNFPVLYTEKDINDFLQMFDPMHVNIFIAQRMAIVEFESKNHSRDILTLLHQEVLSKNRLFVEYAPKNWHILQLDLMNNHPMPSQYRSNTTELVNSADEKSMGVVDALKEFYATAENLNVNQPPSLQLRYEYPKVNRNIIDAIGIALECIPKFYVQCLHLMNRMNLEPPFVPDDKTLAYESASGKIKYATISTQTDDIVWQNLVRSKRKLIESDESELESSISDACDDSDLCSSKSKRAKFSERKTSKTHLNRHELLKQRQKKLLKMQRIQIQSELVGGPTQCQTQPYRINEAFEAAEMKATTIKIVMPDQLGVSATGDSIRYIDTEQTEAQAGNSVKKASQSTTESTYLWSESKLNENRIPPDQLKVYPMFQNYATGDISNRLYLKNIARDVTEADLRAIYERYLAENCDGQGGIQTIDIRLMTSGRMKGQAFINFDGPYLNYDDEKAANELSVEYQMIEKALNETNGLILKGKPLVVVYGKKK